MLSTGKLTLFFLLLLGLILILSACNDPAVETGNSLHNAKGYLAENDLRAAAIELKNALQANPENAEARYLLGLINLDFGDFAGAEKEFRRAIKAGWNEEQAVIGFARALIDGNAFQNVIDEIQIKDEYSQNSQAELYALRAAAFLGLEKLDLAEAALSRGSKLDPKAFYIMKTEVRLDLAKGEHAAADDRLKQALTLYPESRELLLLDAVTALQSQDNGRAVRALQGVIDQEPARVVTFYGREARLRLASLQIMDKQLEQAQTTLKPLMELFPKDPQTNYLGGLLAFAQGNYDKSEEYMFKVLEVVPDHLYTTLLYGMVSFQKKNYEQSANYLAKFVNRVPSNTGARKLLGRAYMMLGQSEQAQSALNPALETDADDVELLTLVGLNEMRGGKLASGIASLQKATEFAPENTALRKELAVAYITSGETELAIKELNTILAKSDEKGNTKALLVLAHLKAGEPDKAIDTALEILAENPDNPAAITLVGNVFAATGDKQEARNYYDKALKLSPGNPQANLSKAQLDESEGNLSAATEIYRSMVDADTKSIVPLLALARLAEKQGDREALFTWLEKARNEAPREVQPRLVLAEAYLRENDLQQAEAVVKESREIAPDNSIVLGQWGRVLMGSQRYNEALGILTKLVEAEPDSAFARVLLAETYLNLKQNEDARKELEIALEKDPESIRALILMSRIEMAQGRLAEAEDYGKKVQAINPDSHIGYELSGDAWFSRKEYAKAKALYEEAWAKNQSSGLALKLSTTAVRMGDPTEGVDVLQAWLKQHAGDVKVLQLLGTMLQSTGREDEAIEIYEKVLVLDPESLVALNNLAGLYSQTDKAKALDLAASAYRVYPGNPGVQDTYGWILVQDGELDKGRSLIKQALNALPKVAEVRYHYAATLIRSGEKTEGTEMLKSLLNEGVQFNGREEAEKLVAEQ
jgi:putative PEP-CTERM system TPR-repeat lipoprotein